MCIIDDRNVQPFYGGKAHGIVGEIFRPSQSKPFMTLRGEWNGEMRARRAPTPSGGGADAESVFLDVRTIEICRKMCRPVNAQEEMESRRYVVGS